MHCNYCGAVLYDTAGADLRCPSCGAAITERVAGAVANLLRDDDHDGIPDVLQKGGAQSVALPPGLEHVPPAPRAPSPRARKLVYGYRGTQGAMLVIGLVFMLVGSITLAAMGGGVVDDVLLATMGRTVDATVVATALDTSVRVNGVHPSVIRFRYTVEGQSHASSSSTLDRALVKSAQPGATVRAEMVPAFPGIARVAGTTRSAIGYFALLLLVFPTLGAIFTVRAWRSNRREIHAFSRGVPGLANVVFQGPDMSTRVNGQNPYMIRWELAVGGSTYPGSISSMVRADLAPLVAGGQIVVLYDPADPAINTVYVD